MFALIASYVRVIGFDMSCPMQGGYAAATYGNNGHNQFLHNYLHDFDVAGCSPLGVLNGTISAQPGWDNIGHHLVSGNVIRHAGAPSNAPQHCNHEHGVYLGDPYDIITNNIISGIVGVGVHSYGGGICHQIISNNTIFDNSQGGIVVENVAVKDKSFWDECGNGGRSDFNTVTNNIIAHNGIGQNYTGSYGGIDGRGMAGGGHNLITNNLVYGNQPYNTSLTQPDFSADQLAGSDPIVFANFQSDPNWAAASDYNFRNYSLRSGSPAVDGGTKLCAPDVATCSPDQDIVGTPRPQGSNPDIGAFELAP